MTADNESPVPGLDYVEVARRALRSDGADALDALGWWEALRHLADPDLRAAVFAVFRAQGNELATTAAIGGLTAQPYIASTSIAPGSVIAALPRRSRHGGAATVVIGDPAGRQLLLDRPGHGAVVVDPDAVEVREITLPGRQVVHAVDIRRITGTPLLDEDAARIARRRSARLGRIALALEILGAAEAAVALAIDHAADREQFGQPIGRFQAVRHLLAWARTDCVAIEHAVRQAVRLDGRAPEHFDAATKALAGRNGRRACERALQVLGGVGFTTEHEHHHHHSRVLALDALLGSSAQLTHELGRWLRTEAGDPGFTTAVLVPDR